MSFLAETLSNTLQMLSSTQDSIKGASRLVKQYNDQAPTVAKVFLDEIRRAPTDRKLLIVYVLHEVMLETKDRNFVMAFGDISRSICNDLAEYKNPHDHLPKIIQNRSVHDKSVLTQVLKIFSVWEKEYLFKKEFVQKLANIIKNKINVLNGIVVVDENTNPEVQPKTNTSKSQGYSKVFMRDYANVQENPLAKQYYERKVFENQCSKYEERITEIREMLRDSERNRTNPQVREKLREALQFLRKSQDEFTELLTSTSDFMCVLSKKLEDETKTYISTNLDKYEMFEKQIQRKNQI